MSNINLDNYICECGHIRGDHNDFPDQKNCWVPDCACTSYEIAPRQNPIHDYFNLSYSSYLVIPRSILQSVPADLQIKFLEILNRIEKGSKFDEKKAPSNYWVRAQEDGKFVKDFYGDYQRGRRDTRGE